MENISVRKCFTTLCLTALIVILSTAILNQTGAQHTDNEITASDVPQKDSKIIRACHSTWGKLGGKHLPTREYTHIFLRLS